MKETEKITFGGLVLTVLDFLLLIGLTLPALKKCSRAENAHCNPISDSGGFPCPVAPAGAFSNSRPLSV